MNESRNSEVLVEEGSLSLLNREYISILIAEVETRWLKYNSFDLLAEGGLEC